MHMQQQGIWLARMTARAQGSGQARVNGSSSSSSRSGLRRHATYVQPQDDRHQPVLSRQLRLRAKPQVRRQREAGPQTQRVQQPPHRPARPSCGLAGGPAVRGPYLNGVSPPEPRTAHLSTMIMSGQRWETGAPLRDLGQMQLFRYDDARGPLLVIAI
mgnify:CR=1 FL=1